MKRGDARNGVGEWGSGEVMEWGSDGVAGKVRASLRRLLQFVNRKSYLIKMARHEIEK